MTFGRTKESESFFGDFQPSIVHDGFSLDRRLARLGRYYSWSSRIAVVADFTGTTWATISTAILASAVMALMTVVSALAWPPTLAIVVIAPEVLLAALVLIRVATLILGGAAFLGSCGCRFSRVS